MISEFRSLVCKYWKIGVAAVAVTIIVVGGIIGFAILFSHNSSSKTAAWFAGIGTIAAIMGSSGIAIITSNLQHKNALDIQDRALKKAKIEAAETLNALALACESSMRIVCGFLQDKNNFPFLVQGRYWADLAGLKRTDSAFADFPLQNLPFQLVHLCLQTGAATSDFLGLLDQAIERKLKGIEMNDKQYNEFVKNLIRYQTQVEKWENEIRQGIINFDTKKFTEHC